MDITIRNTIGPKELASRLGIAQATVYWWLANKGFPHTKIGGRIRFTEEQAAKAVKIHSARERG